MPQPSHGEATPAVKTRRSWRRCPEVSRRVAVAAQPAKDATYPRIGIPEESEGKYGKFTIIYRDCKKDRTVLVPMILVGFYVYISLGFATTWGKSYPFLR